MTIALLRKLYCTVGDAAQVVGGRRVTRELCADSVMAPKGAAAAAAAGLQLHLRHGDFSVEFSAAAAAPLGNAAAAQDASASPRGVADASASPRGAADAPASPASTVMYGKSSDLGHSHCRGMCPETVDWDKKAFFDGEDDRGVTFPTPPEYTKPHNVYIVWRASKHPQLEGLWCCPWAWLEDNLPGQALCGSGVKLERHDNVGLALQHWKRKNGYSVCPRRA